MAATLQVTNIQNAGSATTNLALDTAGNATCGGTVAMASSFLRNRIINGGMDIAQRGTSFTANAYLYTLDRWSAYNSGAGNMTVAQVAGPSGYRYALRLTGAASVTGAFVQQRIEAANIADLAGQTVTLSVTILASFAQTIGWTVGYPTALDNYTSTTVAASGIFNVTTTATRYTATLTLPANAANGVNILFNPQNSGAFTSGTVDITGVQLEAGSTATPFERRHYGQELALCQRYYFKGTQGASGYGTAGGLYGQYNRNAVSMRAAPTGTVSLDAGGNCSSPVIDNLTADRFRVYVTVSGAGGYDAQCTVTLSAEL